MPHLSGRFGLVLRLGLFWSVVAAASVTAQQPPAAPSPPGGQKPPPNTSQQPSPRFTTEASFVRVDVYPTKDGVPVQDLRLEEFEVLENGDRQAIQAFEHVVISPAGPQTMRMEANSVRGGEQMAANPRNRVFVFFLDHPHVDVAGSYYVKEPLIGLMDRILGPDDLVAVMTPEMSAAQVTFGRKTEVIAGMLRDRWHWGQRHSIMPLDQREVDYERCYPNPDQRGLLQELKDRRRERMTLDALHDLVRYLGGVREERKAIVTVTDGWLLYRSNQSLMRVRDTDSPPGLDPIGVDEQGKLRVGGGRYREGDPAPQTVCDRERMHLAFMDNYQHFLDLMDLANRHNASFYPVDPRGLPATDYPMGPNPPPPITIDAAHLKRRIENSIVLATNTDGLPVVNSNNLDKGLRRIADDLTSYYLLGYYSSNTRLDGRYREIKVRVKRPGIEVRARRGYRAATAEEVRASREAAAAPVPEAARTTNAALATLDRLRSDRQFSIRAVPGRDGASGRVTGVWIAGEVHSTAREFLAGAVATIELSGGAAASSSATLKAGERSFLVRVPVLAGGDAIEVRARLAAEPGSAQASDSARVELDRPAPEPLLFRRGPSTGNRVHPAADFRFSRTERLRLEFPIVAGTTPRAARFLDRNGQPLQLPVQVGERSDESGQRWLAADAALAPLGPGDYIVEVTYSQGGTEQRVLTAVRVTR